MRLFADQKLLEFCKRHPSARAALKHWQEVMRSTTFSNYSHLRQFFHSADYVSPFTIFNIGGNQYRVVTMINFEEKSAHVLWILTHPEYDKWCKQYLQGKVKR